jgi:hypothetical protein
MARATCWIHFSHLDKFRTGETGIEAAAVRGSVAVMSGNPDDLNKGLDGGKGDGSRAES